MSLHGVHLVFCLDFIVLSFVNDFRESLEFGKHFLPSPETSAFISVVPCAFYVTLTYSPSDKKTSVYSGLAVLEHPIHWNYFVNSANSHI